MPTFIGSGLAEAIGPGFVSAGVTRFPPGSLPGAGADALFGGGGDDTLDGSGGDDVLAGEEGNDVLRGNTGADVLVGGIGTDTATYSESLASVVVNLATGGGFFGSASGDTLSGIENLIGSNFADTLTGDALANRLDGGAGNDTLRGGAGADTLVGGLGADTATYSESGGSVNVNLATGLGFGGNAAGDVLSGVENLVGSAFGDALTGDAAANRLEGGGGNDILRGDAGADTLVGGSGDDTATYTGSAVGVSVSLLSGLGFFGDAQGDTLSGIENLTGSNGADTLTGDALANRLDGAFGDDFLRGGAGADTLVGAAGLDTASYTDSAAGVVVNLATGTGSGGNAQGDVLSGVENLNGSNFNDTLTGDGLANRLDGFSGDDFLRGGAGGDTLAGGAGNDTISYTESAAGVSVNLATGATSGGNAAGDSLSGIENVNGSNLADTLTGDGAGNRLDGFSGDDVLRGGAGADTLAGGAGVDTASYTESAAGVTVNLTTGLGLGGNAAGDSLSGVENVNGSNLDDALVGDASANALGGFGGDDTLTGGGGRDVLTGGPGNDTFDVNAASESAPGAGARDVITDFSGGGFGFGDAIDLSSLDANPFVFGDQAFAFIGAAAFNPLNATGQLRYFGGVLQGSTDFDAAAEFEIELTGAPGLFVSAIFAGTDVVL